MLKIKIVNSRPYSDAMPSDEHLEDAINEAISEGFRLYGTPFWAKTGDFIYPVFYQAMIKEVSDAPD